MQSPLTFPTNRPSLMSKLFSRMRYPPALLMLLSFDTLDLANSSQHWRLSYLVRLGSESRVSSSLRSQASDSSFTITYEASRHFWRAQERSFGHAPAARDIVNKMGLKTWLTPEVMADRRIRVKVSTHNLRDFGKFNTSHNRNQVR